MATTPPLVGVHSASLKRYAASGVVSTVLANGVDLVKAGTITVGTTGGLAVVGGKLCFTIDAGASYQAIPADNTVIKQVNGIYPVSNVITIYGKDILVDPTDTEYLKTRVVPRYSAITTRKFLQASEGTMSWLDLPGMSVDTTYFAGDGLQAETALTLSDTFLAHQVLPSNSANTGTAIPVSVGSEFKYAALASSITVTQVNGVWTIAVPSASTSVAGIVQLGDGLTLDEQGRVTAYNPSAELQEGLEYAASPSINNPIATIKDIQSRLDGNYKGWFADAAALSAAYPTGKDGWYATVGTTDTFWIWDADSNSWVDTWKLSTGQHNDLVGRDAEGAHPISAITGLTEALETKIMYPTGTWIGTTTYGKGNTCTYQGSLYTSQVSDNVGNDPSTDDGTHWLKTVSKGDDGESSFVKVAYASDATGTGFSTTPSNTLKYRAEITLDTDRAATAADFTGATWVKYLADDLDTTNVMLMSVYDQNENGIVDNAENTQNVGTKTAAEVEGAVDKAHEHTNKAVLDDLSDSSGSLQYKGQPVGQGTMSAVSTTANLTGSGTTESPLDISEQNLGYINQVPQMSDAITTLGNTVSELAVSLDGKQSKLSGTSGQIVGFSADGTAVAQNMPEVQVITDSSLTGLGTADDPLALTGAVKAKLAKVPEADNGTANGMAILDATGKLPAAQLPDDIGGGERSVFCAASATVEAGQHAIVTASGVTVTLPASPADGDRVRVSVTGTVTDAIVAPGTGATIGGDSSLVLNAAHSGALLVYLAASTKWLVVDPVVPNINTGTSGGSGAATAAETSIADAGSYYTGTTVEAALQEIGALLAGLETAINTITGTEA